MRKLKSIYTCLFLAALLVGGCKIKDSQESKAVNQATVRNYIGKVLPHWREGYLDIHAINTGRGESTLLIMPDGTSMLIDAAGSTISSTAAIPPPPQKPNDQVTPGKAVSDYTKHFIQPTGERLDYLMLSHFDPDHMGSYEKSLSMHESGAFRMVGITELGSNIAFDRLIDRGYPNYSFPKDMRNDDRIANYMKFIDWAANTYNTTAEQFAVGRNDQIVMQRQPEKYGKFEIRNICANGVVWTGKGTEVVNTLPSGDEVVAAKGSENIQSVGFVLSYGKFNYFTAGDIQYNDSDNYAWKDVESKVAKVVPAVEVMKASHHGTAHCNGEAILRKLSPQTVVIQPWRDVQPNPETIARMFEANKDCQIFTTNMTEANKPRLGDNFAKLKSTQGHVVVRVSPGGAEYYVYVLEDGDQEYKVKNFFGPYKSS